MRDQHMRDQHKRLSAIRPPVFRIYPPSKPGQNGEMYWKGKYLGPVPACPPHLFLRRALQAGRAAIRAQRSWPEGFNLYELNGFCGRAVTLRLKVQG